MGSRIVADQWGCDVPLKGSESQNAHIDYQLPLFSELVDFVFPPYMLVVSFGLTRITEADGPIEIARGTHRMPREKAAHACESGAVRMESVCLELGDVLIRNPGAFHRGSPNTADQPRALLSIRYVREWYTNDSREVNPIPQDIWHSLKPSQRRVLRFPLAGA